MDCTGSVLHHEGHPQRGEMHAHSKAFGTRRVFGLITVACLLFAIDYGCSDSGKLVIGRQAPNFTYLDLAGRKGELKDLKGKTVFLRFWADWCPYCSVEMPIIDTFYLKNKDKEFTVLAVNVKQAEKTVTAYVEKLKLTYPVALDPKGKIAKKYRVRGLPTNYVINKQGVLKEIFIGEISGEDMLLEFLEPYINR